MRPRALLLTLRKENREMEELAFSLGHDIVGTVVQNRARPDPEFFLGSGKLEEARNLAHELGARVILVNADLKPGQLTGLVRFFARSGPDPETEVEVYDRTRVILEIFKERARSPEARLQVELARLTYEIPLVREAIHHARRGERPGFLAGGSYEVDQYYDMIKRRMVKIRQELDRIRRERDTRRKHRRRGGFHLVSLAGYTNAGKSSLLEALAGTRTLVENRYFSTLSTTTRRVKDARREILLTDTVGFIEDLPPWMVEAFHSTLEEIALADLILLVVDAADPLPEIRRKLRSSLRVLWEHQTPRGLPEAGRTPTPILVVLNKADALPPGELEPRIAALVAEGMLDERHVWVSARTGANLPDLLGMMGSALPGYAEVRARLPPTSEAERIVALLHTESDVHRVDRQADGSVAAEFEARYQDLPRILATIDAAGGSWERREPAEAEGAEKEEGEGAEKEEEEGIVLGVGEGDPTGTPAP